MSSRTGTTKSKSECLLGSPPKKKNRPSCEDYLRMPFDEKVIEHIRSRPAGNPLFNRLVDELDPKTRI
jgi:hypothetical protein